MRDAFGEIDPDEVDVIDFIESDPSAFGAVESSGEAEAPLKGGHRRWVVVAAIASVVGIAGAGVMAWSPWRDDDTASFPNGATPELTLTDRLVFDNSPAELTAASLGEATNDDDFFGFSDAEGYFFAEPGVAWNVLDGDQSGTWAAFFAAKQDSHDAPDMTIDDGETAGTVQGAPAALTPANGGLREITFGPVDGLIFSVVTSLMSLTDSLAFAEAVGVTADGVPTVSDEAVLGAMVPIGDIADYNVAFSTVLGAISPFGTQQGIVSVHYGEFFEAESEAAYSIATQPVVGNTTLAMLQFSLGGEAGPTVHGVPAIVLDQELNQFGFGGGQTVSVVAWVEGGRLIVVSGPDDVDATLALAETVRPATDEEWAQVVTAAQNAVDPFIPLLPVSDNVVLLETHVPETDGDLAVTVEVNGDSLDICVEEQTRDGSFVSCGNFVTNAALPALEITEPNSGRQFVVAIVDRSVGDVAMELRITLADGTIEVFPLVEVSPDLPGPAVATQLPEDHGVVELWIGEKLVKTLTV